MMRRRLIGRPGSVTDKTMACSPESNDCRQSPPQLSGIDGPIQKVGGSALSMIVDALALNYTARGTGSQRGHNSQ
jgi:hypothetical protein